MSLKDVLKSWIKPITAINQAVLPTGNDYTFTPNLGLIKPGLNNYYDIMEHNFNSEVLDRVITEFADETNTQVLSKVDKIEGKGLSTNDYTTLEKNRLAFIKGIDSYGSNVNGHWVRFEDGTQVCYKESLPIKNSQPLLANEEYVVTWTFPILFVVESRPASSFSFFTASQFDWDLRLNNFTADWIKVHALVKPSKGHNANSFISASAIGRWK